MNDLIRAERVRLINENGDMHGVVTVREALRIADDAGLDLVEISPDADPPVCKVMDYGKFKYEQQKKANEARKKQKTIEVKEIQIRPMIGEHDYQVKLAAGKRFLNEGNKIKVTLKFRGREMSHQQLGMDLIRRFMEDLLETGKVESEPRMEGRQVMMIMGPQK